nr:glutamate receptor ionotropic, kainate 1-like [Lepeophtheirus salmonis]
MGKSGLLRLNDRGRRDSIALDIRTVSPLSQYDPPKGFWTTEKGLLWKGFENHKLSSEDSNIFQRRTLIISTLESPPYLMEKLDYKPRSSKNFFDRYEGFVIDLANELADLLHFNYSVILSNTYGSMDKSGQWNGMIRDLLDERADMAIADLTINYQREQVVDFTMPFLDLGISLVYVKAPEKSINLFSFLSPLSSNVWILMILAGVLVSLTMYFIGRYSPLETEDIDSSEGTSPFSSLHHCLWFTIASWVQQGCDFLPRAISGRIVASIWWFFTLIMISSYTANLAAFLTIERLESPINSATDLASQSKIRYGAVSSGSTAAFFESSTNEVYDKMWRFMSRHEDEVMVTSNRKGLEKVISENGGYAFFMESVSIEYHAERNCRLQQIGGLLDSKSYGIALPQGSPLRPHLSSALIKLNEHGIIRRLKNKWWKEQRGGGTCYEEDTTGSVSELNLDNVGGIFMVLIIGLILGSIIAIAEHYYKVIKDKRKLTNL